MAKVPLPERGQPLDVTYLYQLAEAVNDISTQVSSATYNYTTVNQENVKTSEARIFAFYKEVYNNATVTAGQEQADFVSYSNFKYTPVITATVSNISGTSSGSNTTVVLKSVTNSRVDFVVKFGESGVASVGVNVIAVGVPD